MLQTVLAAPVNLAGNSTRILLCMMLMPYVCSLTSLEKYETVAHVVKKKN